MIGLRKVYSTFSKPISTYYIEAKETGRTKNEQSCGKMGRNPSNCENGT